MFQRLDRYANWWSVLGLTILLTVVAVFVDRHLEKLHQENQAILERWAQETEARNYCKQAHAIKQQL